VLYDLEILVAAAVLALVAARVRLPAILPAVTGAPIFAIGFLMFIAPPAAVHVIAAVMPSPDFRFETGQLAASGLPLLYGGVLLVAAAGKAFRWRRSPAPAGSPVGPPPGSTSEATLAP
jgi:hypothetical protein